MKNSNADTSNEIWRRISGGSKENARTINLTGLGLAEVPAEVFSLTRLREINLSDNQLRAIPAQIASLMELRTLNIGNNQISTLPEEIASLRKLHSVNIGFNQLREFPRPIILLNQLNDLNLTGNHLRTIPPEIGRLTALEKLNLNSNEIETLPPEIGELTALEQLLLTRNQLTSLPEQLYSLNQLNSLALGGNQIDKWPEQPLLPDHLAFLLLWGNGLTDLPLQICRLRALSFLNIGNNHLTSLPREISALSSLKFLFAEGNRFTRFPIEVTSLSKLQNLDLSNNRITSIPSQIGSLSELHDFNISENQLTSLPSTIGLLEKLESLDLRRNQLNSLPSALSELPNLDLLYLHGNNKLELSPSLLGPDRRRERDNTDWAITAGSILDVYFGRLVARTRPLNEIKLILVGRGGAGKTSIVRALSGLPFRNSEGSTPGIALSDLTIKGCRGGDVTAHIWDFAGQVITHALHQFFFSERSIYLLTLTGRENSEREDAEYWLRLIRAFGSDDKGAGPSVIVVLNKWDLKGCRPKVDRGALKERYPFIYAFVEVDCKTKKGIHKTRDILKRAVSRLKWVREPFKDSWDQVRRHLTKGRRNTAYVTYARYRELCEQHGISEPMEQDTLADVLHNLGSALNYRNDPRLREATVLQPLWLTRNVYALMRKAEKQAGALKRLDVESALIRVKDPEMRNYLVRLMERFEIAYPSRTSSPATWLIPQALPDIQPKAAEAFANIGDATRLRYTYPALPEGLVARAIVRLHEFIEEVSGKKQQWASGAIVVRDSARALLRTEPQDRQVMLTVIGPANTRRQLAGLCQAELRDIHNEIQGLDPIEQMQVDGAWVSTAALEADERNRKRTGIPTEDRGTLSVDPSPLNNAFSTKDARVQEVWKPRAFICYSKADVRQRKRLESELKILKNEGLIGSHWHDRMIDPGDTWDPAIQRKLDGADIILILLSSAALSTDYITRTEIPNAMKLQETHQATVIPVVLQSCRWDKTKLEKLQGLPEKGKPVNKWKPQSEAWKSIADGLANVCQKLISQQSTGKKTRVTLN